MCGNEKQQASLISYVNMEERTAKEHPLRKIRAMVDQLLNSMDSDFQTLYSQPGRPSILPERVLRALLLQLFYSLRS